jgi:two-component system OmpR family sensor kinase
VRDACPRRSNPIARYVRARLQRRIFVWFGASIAGTALAVFVVMRLVSPADRFSHHGFVPFADFVAERFARVWDAPAERDDLARSFAKSFDLDIALRDPDRRVLATFGRTCTHGIATVPVVRGGAILGYVEGCSERFGWSGFWRGAIALFVTFGLVWGACGRLARRIARPVVELTRVARDIGAGNLASRMRLRRGEEGEVGVLADAVNDMATRIERQMADQRELLAAVSHEIRTPLARIRVLTELARDGGATPKVLDDLDREVVEIDALVGDLLASSRLDFAALSPRDLDPVELAARALERAGSDAGRLVVEGERSQVRADATLVSRALANLLANAETHGKGVRSLRVAFRGPVVAFEVEDAGEGFAPGEERRAFESFYRGARGDGREPGLGLGLALVRRIAEAHGGRALAENREGGGARVAFELPLVRDGMARGDASAA